jgi:hypothetical protein
MKYLSKGVFAGVIIATVIATGAVAAGNFNNVEPQEFDPAHTFLVQAAWLHGIGCPTNAPVAVYPATSPTTTYTACATGDPKDKRTEGLLLAKTGPTNNNASATARLKDVNGTALTELGYDIRKPGADVNDPRGSHCGAGAPRFDITGQDGHLYFIGCTSPPADSHTSEGTYNEWQRLRWGGSAPLMAFDASNNFTLTDITGKKVKSISIVFDEGQDQGPDSFGLAVLDNIDVNNVLVGRGPTDAD